MIIWRGEPFAIAISSSSRPSETISLNEFIFHNGKRAFGCRYEWETAKELGTRAYDCLKKYLEYDKIIVVAHAMLIRQFGYDKSDFPYCGIHQIDFDENSIWNGFNASLIPR